MLTTVIALGAAYVVARNCVHLEFRPLGMADALATAWTTAAGVVDEVRLHMMSEEQREKELATRKAQEIFDKTIGGIFSEATDEEKEVLLALFRKYMPSDQ